jgi:hypothetical protein
LTPWLPGLGLRLAERVSGNAVSASVIEVDAVSRSALSAARSCAVPSPRGALASISVACERRLRVSDERHRLVLRGLASGDRILRSLVGRSLDGGGKLGRLGVRTGQRELVGLGRQFGIKGSLRVLHGLERIGRVIGRAGRRRLFGGALGRVDIGLWDLRATGGHGRDEPNCCKCCVCTVTHDVSARFLYLK